VLVVHKKAINVVVDEKVIFTDLLKDNVEALIKECDDAIEDLEYQKRKIIKAVFPEFDFTYRVSSWHWECKDSPCGMCVYDLVEDRAKDNCLFCGLPEERK
jgi:hypothetical protein